MKKVFVSSEEIKEIKEKFFNKFGYKINIRKGSGCYKGSITVVCRTLEKLVESEVEKSGNWTELSQFKEYGKFFSELGFFWGADLRLSHDISGEQAHTYWNGGCSITLTKYQ